MKINFQKTKNIFKNIFVMLFIAFISFQMLNKPYIVSEGIIDGISYCLEILVPSLFPFMILTSFIVNSGISEKIQSIFSPITKFLFFLPGCTAPAIFLSFVGGYPVGAKGLKSLYEKKEINLEQLSRAMYFSVNSGPAFIISVVGDIFLKNHLFGVTLFFIQITLSLIIASICAVIARLNNTPFYYKEEKNFHKKDLLISQALVESCEETSESMINMCVLVIVFCCALNIFKNLNIASIILNLIKNMKINTSVFKSIFCCIMEMTSGCKTAASLNAPLWVTAFAIGYGGTCAHMQITSILKNTNFRYSRFCLFRLINALGSIVLSNFILNFLGFSSEVFSTFNYPARVKLSVNYHGSIILLALCMYFTVCVNHMFQKNNQQLIHKKINSNKNL